MALAVQQAFAAFFVVSVAAVGFGACTAQVASPENPVDKGAEPIDQVDQSVEIPKQIPNCDRGEGSYYDTKPLNGGASTCGGTPGGACRIGTWHAWWDCVRMPNGQVIPQNVHGTTDFCRCPYGQVMCCPGG